MADSVGSKQNLSDLDSQYVEQLYSLYWNYVCKYLNSRYGAQTIDADDIAQEAFAKLLKLDDPRKLDNPRAFLLATARNLVIDGFRKKKIRLAHKQSVLSSQNQEFSDVLSPENVLLGRQKIRVIEETIKSMPELERTVLLLHRLDNLTYRQIAENSGVSETTVRRQIESAIGKMHKALKRAYGESL